MKLRKILSVMPVGMGSPKCWLITLTSGAIIFVCKHMTINFRAWLLVVC